MAYTCSWRIGTTPELHFLSVWGRGCDTHLLWRENLDGGSVGTRVVDPGSSCRTGTNYKRALMYRYRSSRYLFFLKYIIIYFFKVHSIQRQERHSSARGEDSYKSSYLFSSIFRRLIFKLQITNYLILSPKRTNVIESSPGGFSFIKDEILSYEVTPFSEMKVLLKLYL